MPDDSTRPDPPPKSDEQDLWWPPTPTIIRLMGEHTVEVPLWGDIGLLFASPESMIAGLGVSRELAQDLVAWANDWQTRSGQPAHDAEAAALIRRLRKETQRRHQFVYHP